MNLREKHAYTYGAYSSFTFNPLVAGFEANASVRNAVTDSSIHEILYEMKRIGDGKSYLNRNFLWQKIILLVILHFPWNGLKLLLLLLRIQNVITCPKDFYKDYLKEN